MISSLSNTAQQYFKYLLFNPLVDNNGVVYQDFRAGSSLLFLFPFYIQIGLAQIFYTCEQVTADSYNLTLDSTSQPNNLINLSYTLLQKSIPPFVPSLFNPNLDINKYNNLFGLTVNSNNLLPQVSYSSNPMGIIGNGSSLFSSQDTILFRDRVNNLFTQTNYQFDQVESFIQTSLSNSRINATLIFCQFFNYPQTITQQIINEVELWNINN